MKRIVVFSDEETWEEVYVGFPVIYNVTEEEFRRLKDGEKARDVLATRMGVSIPVLLSGMEDLVKAVGGRE